MNDPHPQITREIIYDPDTRQFAMYLYDFTARCWDLVGFARTYREADLTLDELEAEIEDTHIAQHYGTPDH